MKDVATDQTPDAAPDKPRGYLTLEEHEAKRHTVYEAAPVTPTAIRELLTAVAADVAQGGRIADAIDKHGDNVDNGEHFLCKYELRHAVSQRLGRAALRLWKAEKNDDAADIVAEAIRVLS